VDVGKGVSVGAGVSVGGTGVIVNVGIGGSTLATTISVKVEEGRISVGVAVGSTICVVTGVVGVVIGERASCHNCVINRDDCAG
jgi:hypothetical protein